MLEKELEKKFREAVKKAGGRAYKFTSAGNAGVPDRIAILPGGRIGFVELKQQGKKPTRLQLHQQNTLRGLGCYVTVLDDVEKIDQVIREIRMGGGQDDI